MNNSILYVLLMIGTTALLMALVWYISKYFKQRALAIPNAVEADGEIMDIEPIHGITIYTVFPFLGPNLPKYHPVVKFRLDKERSVKFRNRKGYTEDAFIVGQKVRVQYNREDPLNAAVKD